MVRNESIAGAPEASPKDWSAARIGRELKLRGSGVAQPARAGGARRSEIWSANLDRRQPAVLIEFAAKKNLPAAATLEGAVHGPAVGGAALAAAAGGIPSNGRESHDR